MKSRTGWTANFLGGLEVLPIPLRIHRKWYIYLHENHKNQPNVGKYTSPMDPMGIEKLAKFQWDFQGPPRTWDPFISFMVSGTHTIPIEKKNQKKINRCVLFFLKTAGNSLSGAIFGEEV